MSIKIHSNDIDCQPYDYMLLASKHEHLKKEWIVTFNEGNDWILVCVHKIPISELNFSYSEVIRYLNGTL